MPVRKARGDLAARSGPGIAAAIPHCESGQQPAASNPIAYTAGLSPGTISLGR